MVESIEMMRWLSQATATLSWIVMLMALEVVRAQNISAGPFDDLEGSLSRTTQGRWHFPGENEAECQSPVQELGICITVRRCPGLLKIRDINILRRFICGFEGKTPLLCCPRSYQKSTPNSENDKIPVPADPHLPQRPADVPASFPNHQGLVIYPDSRPNSKYPNHQEQRPRPIPVYPQLIVVPVQPQQSRPSGTQPPQSRPRPPPSTVKPRPEITVKPSQRGRPPKPSFLPNTCGFSNVSLSRVVGGSESQPGAWPWMAAIYVRNSVGYTHACGGALVSTKHVITAAHCVGSGSRKQILPPDIFIVRLGDHNLKTTDDVPLGETLDVRVAGIRRHPEFNPRTYLNDIALMLLAAEVPFTRYIQPVCLPYQAVPDDIVGHYGFVTGWGYTKYASGTGSDVLQQAQIKIWSQKDCAEAFQKEVTITEEYICAGDGLGLQDSCQGDSGGPLVLFDDDRFYLIGIVSFGKRCATPGYPGAYTRITKYLRWLSDNF